VDAVEAARRITVPTLVVVNSADDACPAVHQHDFYAALATPDKQWHEIVGANHYFSGGGHQREHLDDAANTIRGWAERYSLLG
jgi:cephalosporin-C deacetylase-like acetyl esterase